MSLFSLFFRRSFPSTPVKPRQAPQNLSAAAPGQQVRVRGLGGDLSPVRRAHLQAYGVDEGALVRVVQHSPVTVLQVDDLELALERSVADQILVEMPPPSAA